MSGPQVTVLGSVNYDTSFSVQRLPAGGETVHSLSRSSGLGGKAANQAAAASRSGALTIIAGAVGDDDAGRSLRAELRDAGVHVEHLQVMAEQRSGTATIFVDARGENCIVIDDGANAHVNEAFVDSVKRLIAAADVLVLQCEVPWNAVERALGLADQSDTRTVLNLAPFAPLSVAMSIADPLVLNEIEAGQALGRRIEGIADAAAAARELGSRARSVIVTLGSEGSVVAQGDAVNHIPAEPVGNVVDTTGAGDAYVGVLASNLASGVELVEAARRATRAASISVQHAGAASSYAHFEVNDEG